MSALDLATAPVPRTTTSAASRVWRVTRLLTANPWTTVWLPLIIMSIIFVLTLGIWWLVSAAVDPSTAGESTDGVRYNGASSYIFVYMLVVAVQSVNLVFPLALGYGSTRRAFTLGAGLAFLLLSLGYSVVMTLGAWLEQLTGGWGIGGIFFSTVMFDTDAGWLAQWWIYLCWFVAFFFTGMGFASVFVRWKATGLVAAFAVLALLVLGAIALVTLTDNWPWVWEVITDAGTLGIASALLVPAVIAAAIGHLVLRRATPR